MNATGLMVSLLLATAVSVAQVYAEGVLPPFYSAKEIRATVVDAETGRPVEGAVVVAVWELRAMSGEGPRLQVSEVVTDAHGQFFTPAWGPKPRPPLTEAHSDSPYLLIFKGGYFPLRLHNASKSNFARLRALRNLTAAQISYRTDYEGNPFDSVQESLWDGMSIRIEPFRGTPEDWFRKLQIIAVYAGWRDVKQMFRFYGALRAEHEYFKAHPPDPKKVKPDALESFFITIDNQMKLAGGR